MKEILGFLDLGLQAPGLGGLGASSSRSVAFQKNCASGTSGFAIKKLVIWAENELRMDHPLTGTCLRIYNPADL